MAQKYIDIYIFRFFGLKFFSVRLIFFKILPLIWEEGRIKLDFEILFWGKCWGNTR